MLKLTTLDGTNVNVSFTTFSDGSETCVIDIDTLRLYEVSLWVNLTVEDGNRDLIRLGLIKDALDRDGSIKVEGLLLPYVPQARADRVFDNGMPLPIKLFCNIINSYGFKSVIIEDPHSDVTPALLNNVSVVPQHTLLAMERLKFKHYIQDYILCAPDLGAAKKIFDCVKRLGHKDYVQAIKVRDVTTGQIIKCEVPVNNYTGQDILIVDDICDAGGSFTHLAKLLKEQGAKTVSLYVTHGIFAKGLEVLEKDIDFIFCRNIIGNKVNQETILRFNER